MPGARDAFVAFVDHLLLAIVAAIILVFLGNLLWAIAMGVGLLIVRLLLLNAPGISKPTRDSVRFSLELAIGVAFLFAFAYGSYLMLSVFNPSVRNETTPGLESTVLAVLVHSC